jgi:hypothetical protein
MTIKTQGGKVITKGGKVSCECCDPDPDPDPECPVNSFEECRVSEFQVYFDSDFSRSLNGQLEIGTTDCSQWCEGVIYEGFTICEVEVDDPPFCNLSFTGDFVLLEGCGNLQAGCYNQDGVLVGD